MYKLDTALGARPWDKISVMELPSLLSMIAQSNILVRFCGLYLLSKLIK
jgi:hypothetical protein